MPKITTTDLCPSCTEAGKSNRLMRDTDNMEEVFCKSGHKFAELPSETEAAAAETANLPAETAQAAAPELAPTLTPPPNSETIPEDRRAQGVVNSIARTAIDAADDAVQKTRAAEVAAVIAKDAVQDPDSGRVLLQISIPQDRADELKAAAEQYSPPMSLLELVQSRVEFGLENGWFA